MYQVRIVAVNFGKQTPEINAQIYTYIVEKVKFTVEVLSIIDSCIPKTCDGELFTHNVVHMDPVFVRKLLSIQIIAHIRVSKSHKISCHSIGSTS